MKHLNTAQKAANSLAVHSVCLSACVAEMIESNTLKTDTMEALNKMQRILEPMAQQLATICKEVSAAAEEAIRD